MKTACVSRYGAYGDCIMVSPVLRLLKQDGYHVTINCRKANKAIFDGNPYFDEYLFHDETIPNTQLKEHWDSLRPKYDRFINLSESIEKGLLPCEGKHKEYEWSKEKRHEAFNVNYYDRTLALSGYPQVTGLNGELYFSKEEEDWGRRLREQYRDRFWILWSLSGSAFHKTYPFAELVAKEFLDKHPNAITMTVGDDICRLLEWKHKQNRPKCGAWLNTIRKSMIATKYADLVIATETGIANAAGCFDTPKIIMLSHSSVENLTKYWKNCVNLTPEGAECYPCHQIHYNLYSCPVDTLAKIPLNLRSEESFVTGDVEAPICTTRIKPQTLLNAMEEQIAKWEDAKNAKAKKAA